MKPELSIVIAFHEEPLSFIMEAVNQIKETIDVDPYEIIIVDDGSKKPLGDIEGVKVLRQKTNLGVGQALRRGIIEAQSENVWFMGSDIRFIKNNWASKMIKALNDNPKALIATACVGLNNESKEGMDMNVRKNRSRRQAANILIFHDHISHPKKHKNFRSILECQWRPHVKSPEKEIWEVPSILGAAYIAKREWLMYTDFWEYHKSWGTLEPLCSLSSWFLGGSCLIHNGVETGHVFKRSGTHGTKLSHTIYNKIMAATLLFDEYHSQRLINFLAPNDPNVIEGKRLFEIDKEAILAKRKDYEKKTVMSPEVWCEKFNVDFRLG
jgi:glycosyltransferase involved in cell wall biosynthesis